MKEMGCEREEGWWRRGRGGEGEGSKGTNKNIIQLYFIVYTASCIKSFSIFVSRQLSVEYQLILNCYHELKHSTILLPTVQHTCQDNTMIAHTLGLFEWPAQAWPLLCCHFPQL